MDYINAINEKIPKRFNLAVMMFMLCLTNYMVRVNLSLNIIAMVQHPENSTNPSPDYGPRYHWSQADQAMMLGAFFYGYMISNLPGGTLAENFGGKPVAGYTSLFAGFATIITPPAAALNKWLVFILRFLIGLATGVSYPCCHNLISKWAPPVEKGKFVASLMGGTFGTVITWPICGLIIESMGWGWAFYMIGIFVVVIMALWFYIVAETPAQHSTITDKEKEYIETSLAGNLNTKKKRWPPYKNVALSLPFWSFLLLHYGSNWGLYFLITATPKFLKEVLGFKLSSAGFLSSLPHIARFLCAFAFGALGDFVRSKQYMSLTNMRKMFCVCSHILPGICIFILAFFGKDPYFCVAIMTISLGFNGASTVCHLMNAQDLAPNYAGTLYGIVNCIGTTPGFFSPLIVAAFTEEKNTIEQWHYVFIIGGFAYVFPAIFFMVFGSGEIQAWNAIEEEPKKDETK